MEIKGRQVKQKISFKQGRKYFIKERKGIKLTDDRMIIKIFIKMDNKYIEGVENDSSKCTDENIGTKNAN